MTIIFHYWFSSFAYFFPVAVYSTFIFAFSAFLIIASREKEREMLHKKLLLIAAIINIVSTALLYFFPSSFTSYSATGEEEALIYLFIVITSLITYIPRIISFGIIFFIYGHKNRRQIGNYLMYSGLLWLIFAIWASISIFSPFGTAPQLPFILDRILNFPSMFVYIMLSQILSIGLWFGVLANVFLLIHAYSNNHKPLKIAGLIFFIWNATIGLSFIPTYIQYLL